MTTYEHQQLLEQISNLDEAPDDADAYATWLQAESHLELLRNNAKANELIVYASAPHSFIHAVPVKEEALTPLDIDDLLRWSGNPFHAHASTYVWGGGRDEVWIEATTGLSGSATLNAAEPLVYGRSIEGLPGQDVSYIELSQSYSHLTGVHHYPERGAYCRFDPQGDFEDVASITVGTSRNDVSLVTFKWEPLEEYLAASESTLVTMFDLNLLRYGDFDGWPDTPELVFEEGPLFFRQKIDPGRAAYCRGFHLLRRRRSSTAIFAALKEPRTEVAEHVSFIAHDWRNDCITEISTDPRCTTNYFQAEGNSLPFELSPAFFRPEVLAKYKNDTEKYAVEDRDIYCRGGWWLRGYHVNRAGQVHVYICDLRNLPSAEQLYWKSFNENPKDGISEQARKTDFYNQWVEGDSLSRIKHILRGWEDSKTAWWTLHDPASTMRAATPRTGATDEWARELKNLSVLIVEGFDLKALRAHLTKMGLSWTPPERSIALLERALTTSAAGNPCLEGLRSVQRIRTKVDSHARGEEARKMAADAIERHGSYADHFESLCAMVASELERIERAFCDREK